jgi:hypothetical protein
VTEEIQAPKKKRTNKSKPVQRSLKSLSENGWLVAIVEKYIKYPGMPFGKRIDVHGFGDLLACRPAMQGLKPSIALVQCCRAADVAEHRAKILGEPMDHWTPEELEECKEVFRKYGIWKASGGRVFLQGWGFKGPRGEKKRWTMREIEL